MKLINRIKQDQLEARKAYLSTKDPMPGMKSKLLTTLLGEITMPGKNSDPVRTINKFIKNANEIIKIGNTHQVVQSQNEIEILQQYVPKQLTEEEILSAISHICEHEPDINMGGAMKQLKSRFGNTFDGKLAADSIRAYLIK